MLDRSAARGALGPIARMACENGVDWVQVRDRELAGDALLALADEVRAAVRSARPARPKAAVIVNRRADVVLASGADGVHLGFDAMTPADARALLGPDALVGVSVHAPEEIDAGAGAGYVHLAPIHEPRSKPASRPALGTAALRAAADRGLPVLAQGGITANNARDAVEAGAAGVAVTGEILLADDPARATRALREALDERP